MKLNVKVSISFNSCPLPMSRPRKQWSTEGLAGWLTPYLMDRRGLSDSLYLTHRHGFILFETPHTATSGREFSVCGRQWPIKRVYFLTWETAANGKGLLFDLRNTDHWERVTVWLGKWQPMGKVYCLTRGTLTSGKGLLFNKHYRDEWKSDTGYSDQVEWKVLKKNTQSPQSRHL